MLVNVRTVRFVLYEADALKVAGLMIPAGNLHDKFSAGRLR